jgi:putative endopeptidase
LWITGSGPSTTPTNAVYLQNYNAFVIYPYFLNAPYYDPSQNEAFNYGTYTIFAHEITHGFDTKGANFNKIGDYGPIWANEADAQEFMRRASKLSAWYSSFDLLPDEMPGVKANGEGTVTEDIADLGGFEIAFQLYTDKLKADGFKDEQMRLQQQRFYRVNAEIWRAKYNPEYVQMVALGINSPNDPDKHSMEKERINGLVPNTNAWYDLFDVKPGDKLYLAPEERVHIW